ncbi:MAG: hypothetical protein G01um10148_6 [Parcubacteria group bacterium Gr01-1014_8]|nr:MAG: hypothetical protein G01um10148_6 [Parcubacteria group bacterium Gr01-1014_8]
MRKLFISLGLVALLVPTLASLPTVASAQTGGTPFCPTLTQDMWYGSCDENIADSDCARHVTGDQVSQLQHFLMDYFHNPLGLWMSGFFGNKTKNYVTQFQSDYDVPTTGRVGPLTRAAIKQACGATTPPPPPTNPPPAPTCTLNANPSSITLGQSSTLTWSSTNATQGLIISIGSVDTSGSRTISPLQTTTYTGAFWGQGGAATCNTTVTVTPQTTTNASCWFNNKEVKDGESITAYQSATASSGQQCLSESRMCTNGTLSGSYQYERCIVQAASTTDTNNSCIANGQTYPHGSHHSCIPMPTGTAYCIPGICQNGTWVPSAPGAASCTLDGITKPHGLSHPFYSSRTHANCSSISQSRTCTNGTFSGDANYQYANCTTSTGTENYTVTATPSSGIAPLNALVYVFGPASIFNGTLDFGDGSTTKVDSGNCSNLTDCRGGKYHIYSTAGTYTAKFVLDGTTRATATITVTSGTTAGPTVTITSPQTGTSVAVGGTLNIAWTSANAPSGAVVALWIRWESGGSHAFATGLATSGAYTYTLPTSLPPGNHKLWVRLLNSSYTEIASAELLFTVTSGTASATKNSQLASALTALESALKAILQLLGQ